MMTANYLVPATSHALVPVLPRKYGRAVRSVRTEVVVSALRLDGAHALTEKASADATHLATIHEAMISAAPLVDPTLEELREAYKDVAVYLIRGVAGA